MQVIQWYPGHMAKAKRQLAELIKYLDLILEVRDARVPIASHNNDLEGLMEKNRIWSSLTKLIWLNPS